METIDDSKLTTTPLHALHRALGARMVPFAGYSMPVHYPDGILKEHLHTRAAASLFDVSHMGQAIIEGDDPAAALEALVPGDIAGLAPGQTRYTQFTNAGGGIIDDLMATRLGPDGIGDGTDAGGNGVSLVVNASRKAVDFALIEDALKDGPCRLLRRDEHALLALQGPSAAAVLERLAPGVGRLAFLEAASFAIDGVSCWIGRCGYTGEDGFEIALPAERAEAVAQRLLDAPEVRPAGLGARDSLRLEAGLCLYGHDIDETTTPVEAGLSWSIGARRRATGGFPGGDVILGQLRDGPPRRRVGLRPDGRAPAREGAAVTLPDGTAIGTVTSGGFGPTVGGPVAMGYVDASHAAGGSAVALVVRGRSLPATVVPLPFVKPNYVRRK